MSYKYRSTSIGPNLKPFDRFLNWQMQRCLYAAPKHVTLNEDTNEIVYYPDNLKIGEEYFVGPQYIHIGENRKRYEYDVYRLVGVEFDDEHKKNPEIMDKHKELLVFESMTGDIIKVRALTVILNKSRILQYQTTNGTELPLWLRVRWNIDDINRKHREYLKNKNEFSSIRFIFDRIVMAVVSLLIGIPMLSCLLDIRKSIGGLGATLACIPFIIVVVFVFGFFVLAAIDDIIHINWYKTK